MRRRSHDWRLTVLGIGLSVALGAAAAISFLDDRDPEPRSLAPLDSYRVLYRVEHRTGDVVVAWEERIVDRPFRGRSATFRSRPATPGASPDAASLTSGLGLFSVTDGTIEQVAGRVPGLGAGDHALGVVIESAVERGLAHRAGTATVLDRGCTRYRLAGPPSGPFQTVADPDDGDVVCIDEAGLVLHEEWTLDGRVVLTRTAVELDLDPPKEILDRALSTDAAQPMALVGAPRVEEVTNGSGSDGFLPRPAPPPGFGQGVVVRHQVPLAALDPSVNDPGAVAFRSIAWVFTRGSDVVAVEAVVGAPGRPPWPSDPSVRTAVGRLGIAESVLGADGTELRIDAGDGRWIRVRGTLLPREVADYAATLEAPSD